jgi:peroxiredoxin
LDSRDEVLVSSDCESLEHLVGVRLPSLELLFAPADMRDLAALACEGPLVIYTYPGIGWWADAPVVSDLDSAQATDFRAYESELAGLGHRIIGITTQPIGELLTWAKREHISHLLASDRELRLAAALALPTVELAHLRVYERLTLIVGEDGLIRKVFYPLEEPNHAAGQVLSWLYQAEGKS